jgi:hypothetical protein
MALDILSLQILGGKTGSCLLGDCSTCTSQNPNAMKDATARTSDDITTALLHGYRVPPSSSAKTSKTEAARRSNMPRTSIRTQFERRTFDRKAFKRGKRDDSSDAGRNMDTITNATTPPGIL